MTADTHKAQPGMASVPGPARLECFALIEDACEIVPSPPERGWMDAYVSRHPYRCLPLSIANSNGWLVLCPVPIEVEWTGGTDNDALKVRALKPLPQNRPLDHFCKSNFGHGIVTLHTDYIFRTPPGWDMLATGPLNAPKHNMYPLSGIIETDWLPYPFTMNWRMMNPGKVTFEEGEAFCFLMPIPKQALLETQPEIRRIDDDPELKRQYDSFRTSREDFFKRMQAGDQDALKQAWQRYYFTGRHPDGTRVEGHTNKIRLKDPVDLRKRIPPTTLVARTEVTATQGSVPKADFSLLLNAGKQTGFSLSGLASAAAPTAARRWQEGSPLDWIESGQSVLNTAGRARLSDGVLSPSPNTRRITSAAEAADHDFLCIEDALSAAECARLRDCFEARQDLIDNNPRVDPYWGGRMLQIEAINRVDQEATRIMVAALARARARLETFYKLTVPIYADILQIVRWPVGLWMPPHADNANPGGQKHGMSYRDFGAIAYLNDDYEGGELYFTALDIVIKPRRGMFLGFTAGFHHEHAVTKVVSGSTRLTMPSFFTFDRRYANRLLHPDLAAPATAG